ncbi:MAG: hypothetical protein R3F61_20980 [Myxococcota bacterium]
MLIVTLALASGPDASTCCAIDPSPGRARTSLDLVLVPLADRRPEVADASLRDAVSDALARQLRATGLRVTVDAAGPVPGELPVDWGDLRSRAKAEHHDRMLHGVISAGAAPGTVVVDLVAVGPDDGTPWSGALVLGPPWSVGELVAEGSPGFTYFVRGERPAAPVLARPHPIPVAGLPGQAGLPPAAPPVPTVAPVPVAGLPAQTAGLPAPPPPVPVVGLPPEAGLPPLAPAVKDAPAVKRAPALSGCGEDGDCASGQVCVQAQCQAAQP